MYLFYRKHFNMPYIGSFKNRFEDWAVGYIEFLILRFSLIVKNQKGLCYF